MNNNLLTTHKIVITPPFDAEQFVLFINYYEYLTHNTGEAFSVALDLVTLQRLRDSKAKKVFSENYYSEKIYSIATDLREVHHVKNSCVFLLNLN